MSSNEGEYLKLQAPKCPLRLQEASGRNRKTLMLRLLLILALFASVASTASATPAFAQKEKKPCLFCHTNPRGGSNFVNDAGKWYKVRKTLVGFKPATAPGKPAPKKPTPKPAPKKK
jgi:hypothetical protein